MALPKSFGASSLPTFTVALGAPAVISFDPVNGRKYRYVDELYFNIVPNNISAANDLVLSIYKLSAPTDDAAQMAAVGIPILLNSVIGSNVSSLTPYNFTVPVFLYPDEAYRYIGVLITEAGPNEFSGFCGQRIVY